MSSPVYEVVWPLGKSTYEEVAPSQRTADLSGKTICEWWDWLFKGNQIFGTLKEELSQRFPGVKFVDHTAFPGDVRGENGAAVVAELPELFRKNRCDLVVSSVGA